MLDVSIFSVKTPRYEFGDDDIMSLRLMSLRTICGINHEQRVESGDTSRTMVEIMIIHTDSPIPALWHSNNEKNPKLPSIKLIPITQYPRGLEELRMLDTQR